jgi:hypothetical protein
MAEAGMLERWSFPPGEHSEPRMALSDFSEDKDVVLLPGKPYILLTVCIPPAGPSLRFCHPSVSFPFYGQTPAFCEDYSCCKFRRIWTRSDQVKQKSIKVGLAKLSQGREISAQS